TKVFAPSPKGPAARKAPGEIIGAARNRRLRDNRNEGTRGSSQLPLRAKLRPLSRSSPAPGSGAAGGLGPPRPNVVSAGRAASSAGSAAGSGRLVASPSG